MNYIKQILIIVVCLAIASCNDGNNPIGNDSKSILKAERKYLLNNENDTKISIVSLKEYDKSSHLVQSYEYNHSGEISSQSNFSYSGRESKEIRLSYNSSGKIEKETNTFTYSLDGKLLSFVSLDSSGTLISKADYSYDNNGNILKAVEVSAGATSERSYTYVFNQSGNISERVITINGNFISQKDSLVYYSGQPVFDKYTLSPSGVVLNKIKYFFRLDGKLQYETEYDRNGSIVKRYGYEYEFYK